MSGLIDHTDEIHYPESDGQPMADNTVQYQWIVMLVGNIDDVVDGFVAGDVLWYPVRGKPKIRIAPDVLVSLERPKGHRRSYLQWQEEGRAPEVVFEVMSPSNTWEEIVGKAVFCAQHGVREMYVVDPRWDDEGEERVAGWEMTADGAVRIANMNGWISPRLGIRFAQEEDGGWGVYRSDGSRFRGFAQILADERALAERVAHESERAERESERAERLAAKLRALGVEPDPS